MSGPAIDLKRIRAQAKIFQETKLARSQDDVYPLGWSPKTAAQEAALESPADILFFGGAAGSLKTETMLVDAARECRNPNLRAIIFRQAFTQLSDVLEKTHRLYTPLGGNFVGSPNWIWTFPSGAKVRLAYIANDKDVFEYLGPRYSFIGFDESMPTLSTRSATCSAGSISASARSPRTPVWPVPRCNAG